MIYYVGSGVADHQIPHSQGVKLDYASFKSLGSVQNWKEYFGVIDKFMYLNLTDAQTTTSVSWYGSTPTTFSIGNTSDLNTLSSTYVCYYKRNSASVKITTYTGTGVAGNYVEFGFKPTMVDIKRIDSAGNWLIKDNKRTDRLLILNQAAAETTIDLIQYLEKGITISSGNFDANAPSGTHLIIAYADTNANGGDSYYPYPTDGLLNVNSGIFNYSKGLTEKGYALASRIVSKSINPIAQADGWYWIAELFDGTVGYYSTKPSYTWSTSGLSFKDGQWYNNNVLMPQAPSFIPVSVRVLGGKAFGFGMDVLPQNYTQSLAVKSLKVLNDIILSGLPTADPLLYGYLWNSSNVIKISGGV